MYMDLDHGFGQTLISYDIKRTQKLATAATLAKTLFFVLAIPRTPKGKGFGFGGTNRDGFHTTDKLLAVRLGVGVAVVLILDLPLALIAAAMLLDAAAEDSATKACEKLAVP